MINPIRQFRPIIGDDEPLYSMYYRDVPTGFRFDDLDIPETYININAIKERLIDNANRYYRNYEVNGVTLQDFLDNLQLDFNLNADYFEKMLSEIGILEIICGYTEEYEHSVNRDDNTFNTQSIKNNESISKNINDVKNKTNIENGVEDYIGNIDDITNKNNLESNKKNITKNTDSTEKISNVENEITDKKFVESNNNNESILDKSINNNYIYTVIKILSDNRFNSISLYSFKKLYEAYIKSNNYGTYSKLNNYVLIFDNLKKKSLMPSMSKLLKILKSKEKTILSDLGESKLDSLDRIINNVIEETI